MWDDFERFELEGVGQNCGEVSVFPRLANWRLFLPLSSASHELVIYYPNSFEWAEHH